jgi:hypothetical protein
LQLCDGGRFRQQRGGNERRAPRVLFFLCPSEGNDPTTMRLPHVSEKIFPEESEYRVSSLPISPLRGSKPRSLRAAFRHSSSAGTNLLAGPICHALPAGGLTFVRDGTGLAVQARRPSWRRQNLFRLCC